MLEFHRFQSKKSKAIRRRKKRNLLVQTAVPVKKTLQFTIEDSAFCQQLQLLALTKLDMGGFTGHTVLEPNSQQPCVAAAAALFLFDNARPPTTACPPCLGRQLVRGEN